jgi:hypothetical protein
MTIYKEGFCGTIFCKCATLCRVAFRKGVHQKLEGGCRKGGGGGAGKGLGNIFFLLLLCPPLQNILVLVYSRTVGTIEPYLSTVLYINMYINKENTVHIYVYNVDVSLNTLKHHNTSFIITDW